MSLSQSGQKSILGMLGSSKEDLEFERRERARVEARRQRDSERVKNLILNPKQRVMGVHTDSLTRQIQEKRKEFESRKREIFVLQWNKTEFEII